ncbi:MAG: tetratricopeptide repeat protein [Bacteroidetes bacterium]|nr:tetratricopeptide repeat protein [Bacteroidota bacterium]
MLKIKFSNTVYFFLTTSLCFLFAYCGSDSTSEKSPAENPSTYLNHNDSVHHVGINTCKQCHMDIYKTFIHTGMGQSFDLATKAKSSAKFDKHTVVYDKSSDFYYYPFWEGDSFKITEFRLDGRDTIYKRTEKVDYIIGSGQHTNSHIFNTNGYLHQMPMTYYTQKGQWDLPPGFENGMNTRFSRKIGLECMSCHNALPGFIQGSENKYSEVPEGIDCERCHGPGSAHVVLKQQGVFVDTTKEIDYSIVNPAKLSIDLQFDVCQRCHLQGNTVLKEGKSFFDFKPGMKLSDIMTIFLPKYEGADAEFIMASHADRLKMSQCFIKSFKPAENSASLKPYKESLTCVTCHDPHVSVRVTDNSVFNNACKNCHGTKNNILCNEKPEVRNKKTDNCVGCHMPKSGSIDIPHVRVTDHYIRKPVSVAEKENIKKFIGLYAINEKDPSAKVKAQAYINQFEKFDLKNSSLLDSAKKYLKDNTKEKLLNNFPQLVQIYFLEQNYSRIAGYVSKLGSQEVLTVFNRRAHSNDDAWTLYRIGESYNRLGNAFEAYTYFTKAVELAPFSLEFKSKLGTALVAVNKIDEAQAIYESIISENPKFAQAHCNLGYLFLLKGNTFMAEMYYNQALALDPDYEQAIMNKAGLYLSQKQIDKGKRLLQQYIKYHPQSAQVKALLNKL